MCTWVFFFLLRNGIFLDLKQEHFGCYFFLSYVIQIISLHNDTSGTTCQLGYIPLSFFSQMLKNIYNYIYVQVALILTTTNAVQRSSSISALLEHPILGISQWRTW